MKRRGVWQDELARLHECDIQEALQGAQCSTAKQWISNSASADLNFTERPGSLPVHQSKVAFPATKQHEPAIATKLEAVRPKLGHL